MWHDLSYEVYYKIRPDIRSSGLRTVDQRLPFVDRTSVILESGEVA